MHSKKQAKRTSKRASIWAKKLKNFKKKNKEKVADPTTQIRSGSELGLEGEFSKPVHKAEMGDRQLDLGFGLERKVRDLHLG